MMLKLSFFDRRGVVEFCVEVTADEFCVEVTADGDLLVPGDAPLAASKIVHLDPGPLDPKDACHLTVEVVE